MFADLNRHAIRPATSLGVLYDHRDEMAQLTKAVVFKTPTFRDVVEMERSTLSTRSRKLFTLSAIHTATKALLASINGAMPDRIATAVAYWEEVSRQFPEWQLVRERKMNASDIRRDFIHSHGVVLDAIGRVGNTLLQSNSGDWKGEIENLATIDWARSNSKLWEGRAMIGGKVSKASHNVILTSNAIKQRLKLALILDEQRVEDAFLRGDYDHDKHKKP
jgi:DNA sulfur modification protein DndB